MLGGVSPRRISDHAAPSTHPARTRESFTTKLLILYLEFSYSNMVAVDLEAKPCGS